MPTTAAAVLLLHLFRDFYAAITLTIIVVLFHKASFGDLKIDYPILN